MNSLPHLAAIGGTLIVLAIAVAVLARSLRDDWPRIVAALKGELRP